MTGGFAADDFFAALGFTALAIAVVLLVTYLAGLIAGKHSVIDTAWGLLFAAAAITGFLASAGEGTDGRRWLLLVLTVIWGGRLAVHIGRRSVGKGEDPRYAEMLADRGRLATIAVVYGLQGVLAFVVSVPVVLGMFERAPVSWLGVVGAVVWGVGLFFESVGDWQLERFKALKARGARPAGAVMDEGLWRYTRHPNYFGDACVWFGLFLITAERWPGVLTFFSPIVMIYLLAFGSGKKVLERSMARRPGYREYMQRTSGFVPLPRRPVKG